MENTKYLWHLKCKFHHNDFYEKYETWWSQSSLNTFGNKQYSWRITSKGHDFINHHFYECTQVYEMDMTKEWFTSYLKEEPNRYQSPYKRVNKKYSRWARWGYRHDGPPKHYVRQPHHEKKVISEHEQARRDYRIKKGVAKDNAKAYYRRGAGKYWKQLCNQMHRTWSKQNIKKHHTAEMSDTDYKLFIDPWMWD